MMKKNGMMVLFLSALLVLHPASAQEKSAVQGVDFKYAADNSKLELTLDKPASADSVVKTVSEADKQVILEIKDASIAKKFARKLDTSSFKTNVTLISPYQNGDAVRIVLQLKEQGDVSISTDGNKIIASIANGSAATQPNEAPPSTEAAPPVSAEVSKEEAPEAPKETVAESKDADGNLEEFMKSTESRQYTGRKITLQLRDADMKDVFQAISEASEFNIVVADDVRGKVTVNLVEVPWDQVLDIILKSNKLGAERSGNVLRVATMDALTKEKEAELANPKAVEAIEPLVVKIFPISYAKIDDLKKILDDFL